MKRSAKIEYNRKNYEKCSGSIDALSMGDARLNTCLRVNAVRPKGTRNHSTGREGNALIDTGKRYSDADSELKLLRWLFSKNLVTIN